MLRIFHRGFDSRAVANFIVERALEKRGRVNPIALAHYVYLAHGWNLGYTGKPLIKDPVIAGRFGPVIDKVIGAFSWQTDFITEKAHDYHPEFGELPAFSANFDANEIDIMTKVYERYSEKFDRIQLHHLLTDEFSPWRAHKNEKNIHAIIPNEAIKAYYRKLIEAPGIDTSLAIE